MNSSLRNFLYAIKVLTFLGATAIALHVPMVLNLFGASKKHPVAPQNCDGQGVVDEVRSDGIVINDIYFRVIPDVKIKNAGMREPSRREIIKGDPVAFWLNGRGQIRALYILRDGESFCYRFPAW